VIAPDVEGGGLEPQLLEVSEGLLYRQVHPSLFKNGIPTSVNFRPKPIDEGKLSVDRSSMVTAEEAHRHFVEVVGLESVGSWGISVAEVIGSGTTAWADPIAGGPGVAEPAANPAHAFIDFRGLDRPAFEKAAKLLKRAAVSRGRLHPPP
jgi:hypothetical protein